LLLALDDGAVFSSPFRCVSWAVVNGGCSAVGRRRVAVLELNEIEHFDDVRAWFRERLRRTTWRRGGLLTSRRLQSICGIGR
jgi:hypothetical protein